MQIFSNNWVPVWTALAATAATVTALVTAAYTYFTLRLVRAQSEPNVIVYVKHDHDRPSILVITIENIGRDIAHDVQFKPSRPIPERVFGVTTPASRIVRNMSGGPLVNGIPALGPGDSRVITWGQFAGLANALGPNPITVIYSYRHGRVSYQKEARLEVQSYEDTDASESPTLSSSKSLRAIDHRLKAIAEDINMLAHEKSLSTEMGGGGGA